MKSLWRRTRILLVSGIIATALLAVAAYSISQVGLHQVQANRSPQTTLVKDDKPPCQGADDKKECKDLKKECEKAAKGEKGKADDDKAAKEGCKAEYGKPPKH